MGEIAVCPHCQREFRVMDYGRGLKCPNCLQLIDVFPGEPDAYLHFSWGVVGITLGNTVEDEQVVIKTDVAKLFNLFFRRKKR